MAFANITALYVPTAANAGASQWGTDVRKLLDSADAGSDATTITNHGTGGAVQRTCDPYTTSSADSDQSLFGWAITPSDMNSVSGARRFYPAANHTLTVRMNHTGVAGGSNGTLYLYVYRVASAASGRTRTLLGSSSAAVVLPALGGEVTGTVTVALSEVIFEPDETVQYSFEFNVAGIIVTGRTVTFFCGTQSSVVTSIATPKLGVLADTTGVGAGTGAAAGTSGKVLGTEGSSTGTGTATGVLGATGGTTGSAAGTGAATGTLTGIGGMTGAASGTSTADAPVTGIGSMVGASSGSGAAGGVLGAIGGMVGTSAAASTASGVMGATGGTTGSAAGTADASGFMSSLSGTTGSASGVAAATGLTSIVLGTVGTVEIGTGGGDVTVISPVFMFED